MSWLYVYLGIAILMSLVWIWLEFAYRWKSQQGPAIAALLVMPLWFWITPLICFIVLIRWLITHRLFYPLEDPPVGD